ncbi:sensor domain-containing protein [Pararhizobium mangrovi]|uniref:Sensor domain-containing protein n=1 Tax=Pararhizobium mangrovi TaxID=2590452 RepID=A0A506U6D7_9HYPH|nr:sensor domain-containing protein [Pararhizobium mangrovi]TPW29933.1 sensor domain-containing protein [Pararhizobium mangrovi]
MRIVFVYLAQRHQILHTLPIAMEMARRHKDVEVHLAAAMDASLDYMKELARFYPDADVTFHRLRLPPPARTILRARGNTVPPKKLTLLMNLSYLRGFDAIVVPERTTLFLRKFDMKGTQLVWTGHGPGDRASGYQSNVGQFDFILLPGRKLAERHLKLGNTRPGDYGIGGYAKLDLVRRMESERPPLFDNDRPTVVYNPHFWLSLSSWPHVGFEVLDFFAESTRYNLVFAPHLRLFDPPRPEKYEPFERYMKLDHMRIDLGSTNSIDMTYTFGADIYLGDVSSQTAEFLLRPRPMVFLNPNRFDWQDDENYRAWHLGEVAHGAGDLGAALERAVTTHPDKLEAQKAYVAETYDIEPETDSAPRGADTIVRYLKEKSAA